MACPMNPQEIEVLEKFKEVVKDLQLDDCTLMRFLRARELDLKRAEENLRNAVEWQNTNEVSRNLKDLDWKWKPPQDFFDKYRSIYICGKDSEDRLVLYIKFVDLLPFKPLTLDHKAIVHHMTSYSVMTHIQKLVRASKHQQTVTIWDFQDVGLTKICYDIYNWTGIKLFRDGMQSVDLNFPEILGKIFVINCATAVVWGYSFIRPFLSQNTLDKVQMFNYDKKTWMPALKGALPAKVLPAELGGENEKLTPLFDVIYDL